MRIIRIIRIFRIRMASPTIDTEFSLEHRATIISYLLITSLGKPVCTNIDEFLEKFQTAFDPPLPPFFGKNVAIFFYENFWIGNDPPKLASLMLKILQRNFLDRK